MLDALHLPSVGIDGGTAPFFHATGPKFMYRIDVRGNPGSPSRISQSYIMLQIPGYPVFRQQKYAKSARRIPITVEMAAQQAAQVMHAFVEQVSAPSVRRCFH